MTKPKVPLPTGSIEVNDLLRDLDRIKRRKIEPTQDRLAQVMAYARSLSADAERKYIELGEIASAALSAFKKQRLKDPAFANLPTQRELLHSIAAEAGMGFQALRQYKTIVEFYGGGAKMLALQRRYPGLTYTHFRVAKGNRKLDEAVDFLQRCYNKNLTPDEATALHRIEKSNRLNSARRQVRCKAQVVRFAGDEVTLRYDSPVARQLFEMWFYKATRFDVRFIDNFEVVEGEDAKDASE